MNKLDIHKLKTIPVNFEKLSELVEKEVVKKMSLINWSKNLMILKLLIQML